MRILVIGAAGKTGREVVKQALQAGHSVIALVHSSPKDGENPFRETVKIVAGDVNNPLTLKDAMAGCEAVVDTLGGTTPFLETDLEAAAAKVVLEVMPETGTRRLLAISALGVGKSKEQAGFFYEHLLLPVFLRGARKDKAAMENEITHSQVEWVIVRPPVLSDSAATGNYHVVEAGEMAHKITRTDLASFLVEQLTSDAYVGQIVTVANS